jgi:RecA-family ATPase
MIRLVAAAKSIAAVAGCAVMLIHHPSKGDSAGLRGHGSLAAACDAILTIAVEAVSGTRTATLIKSRDSATGLQFSYTLDPVTLPEPDSFGEPRTTIILRDQSTAQRRAGGIARRGDARDRPLAAARSAPRAGRWAARRGRSQRAPGCNGSPSCGLLDVYVAVET